MSKNNSAKTIEKWAAAAPEMGKHVYRLTSGPEECKHSYHVFSPWSPNGKYLLFMRYKHDRSNLDGEICVFETATGEIKVVGISTHWDTHTAAYQHWLGNQNRIAYCSGGSSMEGDEFTLINVDGGDKKVFAEKGFYLHCSSPDGRYMYGVTPRDMIFPGDTISELDKKGILRVDLETGKRDLIFSIAQCIENLPNKDKLSGYHLYPKMMVVHPVSGRILFNFVNSL
nr:hypothetical protein [Victivallales bacterium]